MTDEEKLQEFLSLLDGVEDHGDYWTATCPGHKDLVNSLSISRGDKTSIVVKCHANCELAAIMHGVGKTISWLFPNHGRPSGTSAIKPKGTLVASYDYHDEDGVLLRQSCRYEQEVDGITKKTFIQRRPNGKGGWINSAKGVRNVPYRLPDLIKSHKSEMVLIAEGEKHVDRLVDLGFVATCNVGGAGKWNKSFAKYFLGRDVVILPDNDDAGQKHAADVCAKVKDVANSIRCVELPNLPPKGDVIDWLAAGGTSSKLRSLIDGVLPGVVEPPKSKTPDPVATDFDEKCCQSLGLFIYGEDEQGRVKVFSEYHRKSQFIRDVNRLTVSDLFRICGPPARQVIYTGEDDTPEGMFKIKQVKESIAILAGFRRVTDDSEIGIGVWEGASEAVHRDSIVLVNAGEAAVLNGDPYLKRHAKPKYGELFIDLGSSQPWFNFDQIDGYLRGYSPEWSLNVAEQTEAVFGKWRFAADHQEVMPAILTGLVMASWVQTIWRWRPQVFIYGKSASGKSTMFRTLTGNEDDGTCGLFGRLAMASGDVSAAGVAQALSSTARIAILDELERSPHRKAIMQMLRNSGGGSRKLRGSTHHKAVEFKLRHLVWAAATETGLKQEPDTNRFIAIELIKPPDAEMGDLDIPEDTELQKLGFKLLAVAVKTVHAARELVDRLRAEKPPGYHARVVETYAVPAACYAMACGQSFEEATETHARMLETHDVDSIEGDEERLVGRILDSIIKTKEERGYEECSVAQALLRCVTHNPDLIWQLERYGISVMSYQHNSGTWISEEEHCVFLYPPAISEHLLKNSEWTDANIGQVLSRFPQAIRCRKSVSKRQVRGILVPYSGLITPEPVF